jgi:hypothetical protein
MTRLSLQTRQRTYLLVSFAVFILVFLVVINAEIASPFRYLGYESRDESGADLAEAILASLLLWLACPLVWRRPSQMAQAFLSFTVALPITWIPVFYGHISSSDLLRLHAGTVAAFVMARLMTSGARGQPTLTPRVRPKLYWTALIGVTILGMTYLLFDSGLNLHFAPLSEVYTQRAEYAAHVSIMGKYIVGWLGGGTLPVILSIAIYQRRFLVGLFSVIAVISLYGLTANKTELVGLLLVACASYLCRRVRSSWSWGAVFVVGMVTANVVSVITSDITAVSILVRRALASAGINTSYYFQYFSTAPKYELRHSVLSFLGSPPFDVPPANLMAAQFYGSPAASANANFVADGYANFGLFGCALAGVVVGLFLRLVDRYSDGLPLQVSAPALVFVLQAFANSAPLTVLATHGGIVLLIWIALLPRHAEVDRVGNDSSGLTVRGGPSSTQATVTTTPRRAAGANTPTTWRHYNPLLRERL